MRPLDERTASSSLGGVDPEGQSGLEARALADRPSPLSELKRMRLYATGLLVLMLALFVATSVFRSAWPWLAWPRAFAEASVVGACADWFAVVALFRHPLGIPIPHTAIIPKQKQRIGEAAGRFIASNFLAPAELAARIERLDAAGWLAGWLKEPANVKLVISRSQGLAPPLLDLLGEEKVRDFSRAVILGGVDSIAAAPLAARGLSVLVSQGHYDPAFDVAIDAARGFLETHRDAIRERVVKNSSVPWLSGWVDARVADAILTELLSVLAAARAGDHPWRAQGRATVGRFIARLADDRDLYAQLERFKARVLDQSVVDGYLDWLGGEAEAKLGAELGAEDGLIASGLEHALLAVADWLERDAVIRSTINDWAQRLVLDTVVASRDEIGAFVAEVVERWDTATLVERLELQVGRDLQYIRINGALVGGLVGLIIFAASRLFG